MLSDVCKPKIKNLFPYENIFYRIVKVQQKDNPCHVLLASSSYDLTLTLIQTHITIKCASSLHGLRFDIRDKLISKLKIWK